MKKNKSRLGWDGHSRIVNDTYRKNFNEIFGQKEQEKLNASYQQSLANKKEREEKEKKDVKESILKPKRVFP